MRTITRYITLFIFIFLFGCANHESIKKEEQVKHSSKEHEYYCSQLILGSFPSYCKKTKDLSKKELKERNSKILKIQYKQEREYLDKKAPKLGLALSGGGTRAASFSIGVMKGLKETGVLDSVEVISSVSGGSYASYWYLSKLKYEHESKSKYGYDIFRDSIGQGLDKINVSKCTKKGNSLNWANCYRFQHTLENSSKILSWSKKPGLWSNVKNAVGVVGEVGLQFFSMPAHWIVNGFFDWEINMTPYRRFYQNGLERTYGYVPKDASLENFINDEGFLWYPRVSATEISFENYRGFLEKEKQKNTITNPNYKKAPYFIINTTGRFGRPVEQSHDDERTIEKEVFEFTPWKCGSLLFDYKVCSDTPSLSKITWAKAVSISGAAVDGQYSKLDDNGNRLSKDFSDYLAAGLLNIMNGDLGYHLDNYNTPTAHIWGHKLLPFPLYFIHDWVLSNNELRDNCDDKKQDSECGKPNDTSTSIYLNDGGASENLGLFSLVRRGVKQIIVVDGEYDPESTFQAAKFVKNTLANYGLKFTLEQTYKGINVYDASPALSVIKGKIKFYDENTDDPDDINLIYIKLAIQAKHVELTDHGVNYPYTVKNFMEKNKAFPHNTTADISYDKTQFMAYRDLGYTLGKCVTWDEKAKKKGQKILINNCKVTE